MLEVVRAAVERSVATSTSVIVSDLRINADIGINADEIGRLQPLNVTVILRLRDVDADEIGATIDYRAVVGLAEMLAGRRTALIETFARRLAAACLDDPAVIEADVTIAKPRALAQALAAARVVMTAA